MRDRTSQVHATGRNSPDGFREVGYVLWLYEASARPRPHRAEDAVFFRVDPHEHNPHAGIPLQDLLRRLETIDF